MSKLYDTGLIVGRFQTVTNGHEHLIDTARKLCDRIVLFVGSAQECGTLRNPLNIATRIKLLRELYPDEREVLIYGLSDLTKEGDDTYDWGNYLLRNAIRYLGKVPECMIYGLCKEEEGRATKWYDLDKHDKMSFMMVPTNTIPIRATTIRELMVLNEREEWMKWVNSKLHKHYDPIRSELMSIEEYKLLEKELLYKKLYNER